MPVSSTQNNLDNEKDSKACEGRIRLPKRMMFRENSQRPLKIPEKYVSTKISLFWGADKNCPLSYEPSGSDFLSPCIQVSSAMWTYGDGDSKDTNITNEKKSRNNLVLTGSWSDG